MWRSGLNTADPAALNSPDPAHPERAEQVEWIGEGFDPDAFVIETANTMLAAQFKHIQPSVNRPSLD